MCMSVPKVPTMPDRQAAKSPDNADTATRGDERGRRRMAMAAAMTKGAGGMGGGPRVTNAGIAPAAKIALGA